GYVLIMSTITAPAEQQILDEVPKQLYIAGQWRDGSKGQLRVEDPATGEILRRAFEAIVAREEELALLMTLEMGKPLKESKAEIAYGAEFFRWFSEQAVRIDGRYAVAPNGQGRLLTMKQPVGPCLLITPWNFPLAMGTRKVGPAIAAGCTIVV